jgi:hypothetical protein
MIVEQIFSLHDEYSSMLPIKYSEKKKGLKNYAPDLVYGERHSLIIPYQLLSTSSRLVFIHLRATSFTLPTPRILAQIPLLDRANSREQEIKCLEA